MLNDMCKVCRVFIPKLFITMPLVWFSTLLMAQSTGAEIATAPVIEIAAVSEMSAASKMAAHSANSTPQQHNSSQANLSQDNILQTKTVQKPDSVIDNFLSDRWEVNGFATLGYADTDKYRDSVLRRNVYQDTNEIRENSFKLDSRIGVQVSGELSDRWDVVLQGVLKHQYISHVSDYIDVAMVRYQANNEWQISLGRQPFDLFFMSDHRNVGYSYDWVRPPTEFYGIVPYDYFDGAKFTRQWGDFDNEWSWSFSVGLIEDAYQILSFEDNPNDDNEPCEDCGPPGGGSPDNGPPGNGSGDGPPQGGSQQDNDDFDDTVRAKPIYNTELTWRTGNWHLRANYAYLKYEQELDPVDVEDNFGDLPLIWPGIVDFFQEFTIQENLHYYSLGGIWERGNWKVQAEVSHSEANQLAFSGQRGYLHVRKRWGDWSPFITFGFANDNSSVDFQRLEETDIEPGTQLFNELRGLQRDLDAIASVVKQNQNNLTIGVRWDFSHKKALKFQCDRIHTDAFSGSIHSVVRRDFTQSASRNWCSATLDWVF